jgi:hypothetical protein
MVIGIGMLAGVSDELRDKDPDADGVLGRQVVGVGMDLEITSSPGVLADGAQVITESVEIAGQIDLALAIGLVEPAMDICDSVDAAARGIEDLGELEGAGVLGNTPVEFE